MNKYTFTCIVPGCGHSFVVTAEEEIEAVDKILNEGEEHNFDCHEEMPILSEEKIKLLVEKGIKKID